MTNTTDPSATVNENPPTLRLVWPQWQGAGVESIREFFSEVPLEEGRRGYQDFLTLEYEQEKLSRYSVEWQPDDRHLARVGNPRFYRHPYQSPQQELWEEGSVEWFVIIRNAPPVRRRKHKSRLVVMQLPLLPDGTQA